MSFRFVEVGEALTDDDERSSCRTASVFTLNGETLNALLECLALEHLGGPMQ